MLIDLKNLLKNKFNQAKIAFTLKKMHETQNITHLNKTYFHT